MPYTASHVGYQRTDTSENAAHEIAPSVKNIRAAVLAVLKAASVPLTSEELAEITGLPYCSVQPRLSELRNAGKVTDSQERRIGRYGKPIIAWVVG